jgi:uncharacterized protein YndB with AHSA1/START domain
MRSVTIDIDEVIARPVQQVFEQATDLAHFSDWMPGRDIFKQCSHISEQPIRLGTTYSDEGWMGTFDGKVIEYERPARVVYEETLRWLGRTVFVARLTYTFSPTQNGTLVHHAGESKLYGVFGLMRPGVARIARGERRRTMEALKSSLEAAPPEATEMPRAA